MQIEGETLGRRHQRAVTRISLAEKRKARQTFRQALAGSFDVKSISPRSAYGDAPNYHHSIRRLDVTFALLFGLGVRSSRTGQGASLTTFSAIDPNTDGYHPDLPCVEITT